MSQQKIKVGFLGESTFVLDSSSRALNQQADISCSVASLSSNWTKQPDVLLLESEKATERTLKQLSQLSQVKLVILNADVPGVDLASAIRYGVLGFVPKSASLNDVASTIRKVARGERVLPELVTRRLVEQIYDERHKRPSVTGSDGLTRQECHVARLIADGLSNQEIAENLCISVPTVKAHVQHVFRKLGCHKRVHVAHLFLNRSVPS